MAKKKNAGQSSDQNDEKKLIAVKDWRILAGSFITEKNTHEHDFRISAGDDVSGLPGWALEVLRTEKVI